MSPQDLRAKATTVDYKQLEKDPVSFQGKFAKFTGQILQIEQQGSNGVIRLSVTNEGYGIWSPNDVVYVEYNQATKAVQDDVVTVYDMLNGTQTHTSQANYQITIPDMVACAIGNIAGTSSGNSSTSKSVSAKSSDTPPKQTTSASAVPPQSSATIHTPAFALQGQQQKIDYTCSVLDSTNSYGSTFNGIIHETTGYNSDVFAQIVTCPTSNTTYEYSLSPGQYYLDLSSTNASYTATQWKITTNPHLAAPSHPAQPRRSPLLFHDARRAARERPACA